MKTYFPLACVAIACVTSACSIREERTIQPAPSTAVVAPVPSTVVYTDPVPATTTTTVYTR